MPSVVYGAGSVMVQAGGCNDSNPYLMNPYPLRINPNETKTFTLEGINFRSDTTVEIIGLDGSINSVAYVSSTEMILQVTAGETQTTYDIVISNSCSDNSEYPGNGVAAFVVSASDWVDLRQGGDSLPNIRTRAGMTVERDADGMFFTGRSPWGSWVKFEDYIFNRNEGKTLEWVFRPESYFMVGLGSDETDESSNSQWNQAEWMAYFSSSSYWWGMYGNSGTSGTYQNQSIGQNINAGGIYKLRMSDNGASGNLIELFELPSATLSDWDDESNLISSVTSVSTADADNLMPFIIPQNGGAGRYLGFKVE